MLQVDDDCLYEIFIKLSLSDQVNAAKACSRFRDVIYDMIWRSQFQNIDTANTKLRAIKSNEFKFILKEVESTVTRLRISKPIGMLSYRIDLDFYAKLKLCNLIEFECTDVLITDDFIQLLSINCLQLRKLSLQSRKITGQHIPKLRCLDSLTIEYCSVDELNMTEILSQLQLKYLTIYDNSFNIEPALLNTPSPTLKKLVIDNVRACGMQLFNCLPLQSLHYEATFTSGDEKYKKTIATTTFESLSEKLQSLDVGVLYYSVPVLIKYLPDTFLLNIEGPEEGDDFVYTDGMLVWKPLLHMMDFCKRLACFKLWNFFSFDIDDFKFFIRELKKRQRSIRLILGYTQITEYETRLQNWHKDPTSAYNKQKLLTLEFEYIPNEMEQLNFIKFESFT